MLEIICPMKPSVTFTATIFALRITASYGVSHLTHLPSEDREAFLLDVFYQHT